MNRLLSEIGEVSQSGSAQIEIHRVNFVGADVANANARNRVGQIAFHSLLLR